MSAQQRRSTSRREGATGSRNGRGATTRNPRPAAEPTPQGVPASRSPAAASVAPAAPVAPSPQAVPAARSARPAPPARPKGPEADRRSVLVERTEGIRRLAREILSESRKVNWPDRETTRNLTVVVIGISIALGAALGGIDWVLFQIFEAMT